MLTLIRDGQHDPPIAMAEVPEPVPARDQALVEVHASSLNRGELALLSARSDGWRPGQDIAGVVVHQRRPVTDRAPAVEWSGSSRTPAGQS